MFAIQFFSRLFAFRFDYNSLIRPTTDSSAWYTESLYVTSELNMFIASSYRCSDNNFSTSRYNFHNSQYLFALYYHHLQWYYSLNLQLQNQADKRHEYNTSIHTIIHNKTFKIEKIEIFCFICKAPFCVSRFNITDYIIKTI